MQKYAISGNKMIEKPKYSLSNLKITIKKRFFFFVFFLYVTLGGKTGNGNKKSISGIKGIFKKMWKHIYCHFYLKLITLCPPFTRFPFTRFPFTRYCWLGPKKFHLRVFACIPLFTRIGRYVVIMVYVDIDQGIHKGEK